jgi:hypothetical protein
VAAAGLDWLDPELGVSIDRHQNDFAVGTDGGDVEEHLSLIQQKSRGSAVILLE